MKSRWIGVPLAALMTAGCGMFLDSAHADEALAQRSGCMECHVAPANAEEKSSGPTFHDISTKYRGDASARAALIQVVKKGGKGKWPESRGVPMPPYSPRLTDAEIQRLVDWVLRN